MQSSGCEVKKELVLSVAKDRERQGMPLSEENTLSRHPDSLIATCPHDDRERNMEFP